MIVNSRKIKLRRNKKQQMNPRIQQRMHQIAKFYNYKKMHL